uniref:Candidate secreted effector n=1 Tax=Meloidogyne incognita TaxID=6306 RepID=A0A914M8W6_MELIC
MMFALQIDKNRKKHSSLYGVSTHVITVMFHKEAKQINYKSQFICHIQGQF